MLELCSLAVVIRRDDGHVKPLSPNTRAGLWDTVQSMFVHGGPKRHTDKIIFPLTAVHVSCAGEYRNSRAVESTAVSANDGVFRFLPRFLPGLVLGPAGT